MTAHNPQSSSSHPEQLASAIATEFGVSDSVILSQPSKSMNRRESYARQVYAYVCSRLFPYLSQSDIAATMQANRTSVSRGITKIAFEVDHYTSTREMVSRILSA